MAFCKVGSVEHWSQSLEERLPSYLANISYFTCVWDSQGTLAIYEGGQK